MSVRPNGVDDEDEWREVRPSRPAASRRVESRAAESLGESAARPAGVSTLEELRGLLLGKERERLRALEARPTKPAVDDVASLLPEAVRRRAARDEDLARALGPTIDRALAHSARDDAEALAEALHPALGPALRKALWASFRRAGSPRRRGADTRPRPQRQIAWLVVVTLAAVVLVVGASALWRARAVAGHHAEVLRALGATPGLLVLGSDEHGDSLRIRGLADPAARPPSEVAAAVDSARGLTGLTLEFAPFEAPGVEFAEARLRRRLAPPPGVEVAVDGAGVARLAGEAPSAWVERARAVAPTVTGVVSVDASALVDVDRRHVVGLAAAVDGLSVGFALGRADLDGDGGDPASHAGAVRARIADLGRAAARAGVLVHIELVPVRDELEGADPALALRRMAAVRALLEPEAPAPLLFEPRLVVDGALEVAESGAVRLVARVLGPLAAQGLDSVGPGRE